MFSSERDELRKMYFTAWEKHLKKLPVEPLEAQIIAIILQHPEYHAFLENPDKHQAQDFIEGNPFLHLGLHLALREQISTNRPFGIKDIYHDLMQKYADNLLVEHRMMECLERVLWEAQRSGVMPDEGGYLESLQKLAR